MHHEAMFKFQAPQSSKPLRSSRFFFGGHSVLLALACALPVAHAADTSPATEMQRWSDTSGAGPSAERGKLLFTQPQGGEWSCASCHGNPPTAPARHASTGKTIAALAPGFNPERFTNTAKVDKWFDRNCKDVFKRECTASEKADILTWLVQFRR